MRIILAVSCLPSILLMIFVYKKDRVEKEPGKLLLLLFVLGAVSCLPAALMESFFSNLIGKVIGTAGLHYQLYENFLNVALIEELGKFVVLFLVTHKNKHFNSLFDGIVYSVFVSLGFATLENILYVYQYGLGTGLLRAVTAIPSHMFDGVLMGQFYGLWHLSKDVSMTEKMYARMGYIDQITNPETRYRYYLPLSLIIPILTHGLYDFLASIESVLATVIFFAFLIGLYVYCFYKINKISKMDQYETNLIAEILGSKYPYLYGRIQHAMYQNTMQYNPFTQVTYSPYSSQNTNTPYMPQQMQQPSYPVSSAPHPYAGQTQPQPTQAQPPAQQFGQDHTYQQQNYAGRVQNDDTQQQGYYRS